MGGSQKHPSMPADLSIIPRGMMHFFREASRPSRPGVVLHRVSMSSESRLRVAVKLRSVSDSVETFGSRS